MIEICRGCGRRFQPGIGAAGQYCSRRCYEDPYRPNRAWRSALLARLRVTLPPPEFMRPPQVGQNLPTRARPLDDRSMTQREFMQQAAKARRSA